MCKLFTKYEIQMISDDRSSVIFENPTKLIATHHFAKELFFFFAAE